jgi:hypothetical protein
MHEKSTAVLKRKIIFEKETFHYKTSSDESKDAKFYCLRCF